MKSSLRLKFRVIVYFGIFLAQDLSAIGATIALRPPHSVRRGIEGFPRIAEQRGDAAKRINLSLSVYERSVLKASRECDNDIAQNASTPAYPESNGPNWERSIKVTMRGPRFVSYRVDDFWFCGGVHPDSSVFALTYDLDDGTLVDWTQLLSATAAQVASEKTSDGLPANAISSEILTNAYVSRAKQEPGSDCPEASVFAQEIESSGQRLTFSVWPDAASGRLVIKPNLPHVIYACGVEVGLEPDQQRALGLAESMVMALTNAHRYSVKRSKRQ